MGMVINIEEMGIQATSIIILMLILTSMSMQMWKIKKEQIRNQILMVFNHPLLKTTSISNKMRNHEDYYAHQAVQTTWNSEQHLAHNQTGPQKKET